ncbi:glycoside hydrolase family 9 protein [Clostridium felsineum]|uniref:glycoside hydrolase family 9 protein n=1 Tax=Clostridium felsineum TaxID=36839 RepID=UPI00098C4AC0|nr:glycoside hydrolase family 9 protein [Clostridium felsineum]URZ01439.1 Endoglucanase 1 [Clostridium felsineum]
MKKLAAILTIGLFLGIQIKPLTAAADATQKHNYVDAFSKSILFYEANWCGPDAGNNRFKWRSGCHENDGKDVGLDLTGGFHDAGDHVKFGITQAYSASTLGWAYYEFKDTFVKQGQDKYMLNIMKHFTDYFLKCYPDNNTFYYQCGNGDTDHSYWGPPELQTTSRPTLFKATPSTPASDVCGNTAGALALMYLNYKDIDSAYANKCLTAAESLYNLGKNYKGLSQGQSYYTSSGYWDDLSWGAIWLYEATNNNSYLSAVQSFLQSANINEYYQYNWTHCWDDMLGGVFVKMAQITGDDKYKKIVNSNIDYWTNSVKTTPGGLKFRTGWGTLRYTAAECMLALVYYKTSNESRALDLAKGQIDYILGSNPQGMSYEVGFGDKYPKFPHHRAASGRNETAGEKKTQPEKHILYGALVGGPDESDNYQDNIEDYQHSEVAIDYNAGFVGALAGISNYFGQGQTVEKINDPEVKDTTVTTVPGDLNDDGVINGRDIMMMRQYLAGKTVNGLDKNALDVNGDGIVNGRDLMELIKKVSNN